MSQAILITGATGQQGGGAINALLAAGTDFKLLAVTRDPASPSAQSLAAKSPQIALVQGNLDDTDAIFESAKKATTADIWGVFSVQSPAFGHNGAVVEEKQGKQLVDSAIKYGVRHFVYSSVDRHGDRSIDNPTDIPHFISKHNIEHHLIEKAKGSGSMSWTILRPVAFMENFGPGFPGKIFATAWRVVVKSRPLQLVAVEDIGVFAAKAFADPESYKGRSISLAGDELTFQQMATVYEQKVGTKVPETWGIVARLVLWLSKELGTMFAYFEREGYAADIAELKKLHPGLKSLGTWLEGSRYAKKTA